MSWLAKRCIVSSMSVNQRLVVFSLRQKKMQILDLTLVMSQRVLMHHRRIEVKCSHIQTRRRCSRAMEAFFFCQNTNSRLSIFIFYQHIRSGAVVMIKHTKTKNRALKIVQSRLSRRDTEAFRLMELSECRWCDSSRPVTRQQSS